MPYLENANQQYHREEGVEMNVHCVEPLHRLFRTVGSLDPHVLVHQVPDNRCNCETTQEGEENALNHRFTTFALRPLGIHDAAEAPRTNGPRIRHGNKLKGIGEMQNTYGHKEERDENKGRIITCPLIARL